MGSYRYNIITSKADGTNRKFRLSLLFLSLLLAVWPTFSQEPEDTTYTHLENIEVTGVQYGTLKTGGGIELSKNQILAGKHIMGEADFMKSLTGLSGVTTGGDYGSGLMIDGNLAYHTLYRIDKVPVFFPYRFGGIFSTFNSSHFRSTNFERSIHDASMPARLGSLLDYKTNSEIPGKIEGTVNIGLISSSVNISVPIGSKLAVSASARASYLDQIYSSLLHFKETEAKYNFQDYNFSATFQSDASNFLTLNGFFSNDNLRYDDSHYIMTTSIRWNNGLASLSWRHDGGISMTHRVYTSIFSNRFALRMPQLQITAPSALTMAGISGEFDRHFLSPSSDLSGGYEINIYRDKVQQVSVFSGGKYTDGPVNIQRPVEARIYADTGISTGIPLKIDIGLSLFLYFNGKNYTRFEPDPRLTLSAPLAWGTLSFHLGRYSQVIHQVGFSQVGLASDFWIVANKNISPENTYNLDVDYTGGIPATDIKFSINAYAKWILHQSEYFGDFISIINSDYNAEANVVNGNGYATGFNFQLRKTLGRISGNAGIGYGIVRLKFPAHEKYSRGRSEPGLSFNADITYNLGAHWDLGATFKYMSGRPYTPITSIYLIAGNIMCEYGDMNSKLLPSWNRLDLSATYKLRTGMTHPLTHLVNISVLNVYGRKNPESIRYDINMKEGTVELKYVNSLYRFLPSLSYTLIF